MYVTVLFLHSWLRYLVLGLGLAVLVMALRGRGRGPWTPRHERLHVAFVGVVDLQLLLGLALYFLLSPISEAALSDLGAAMKDASLRFFGVEHAATMLLAVVAAHVGRARSRRKQGVDRFRSLLWPQVLWLLLTLAAIPWPALDIGRPLFRGF